MILKSIMFAATATITSSWVTEPFSSGVATADPARRACDAVVLTQLSEQELAQLKLRPLTDQFLRSFLRHRVDPGCARHVRMFDGGRLALDGGRTFTLVSASEGFRVELSARPIKPSFVRSPFSKEAGTGQFLFGRAIGSWDRDGASYTENIGIWRVAEEYELRGFLMRGDTVVGEAKPVLRSSFPIRSIGYSPLPDAPAGSLHLQLERGAAETILLSLSWQHPGFFTLD